MAGDNESPTTALTTNTTPVPPFNPVVPITAHHHLPIKLTASNYPTWRALVLALLHGYNLIHFITGDKPSEDAPILTKSQHYQQDQLLFSAILGSVSAEIQPLINTAPSSAAAWGILTRAFASTSRQRVMLLKKELARATIGSKSVAEFANYVKARTDELALIDEPVKEDDITIYILNGLGTNFQSIISAICARATPLKFEELRDLLIDHETILKNQEAENSQLLATANYAKNTGGSSQQRNNSQQRTSNGGRSQH